MSFWTGGDREIIGLFNFFVLQDLIIQLESERQLSSFSRPRFELMFEDIEVEEQSAIER